MSHSVREKRAADEGRPYGADPTRPFWPVVVWALLYGLWFLALIWMALWHTSPR